MGNTYSLQNDRNWDCLARKQWYSHTKNDYNGNKNFVESYITAKASKEPVIKANNGDGTYQTEYFTGTAVNFGVTTGKIADNSREDGKHYQFDISGQVGNYLGEAVSFDATSAYAGSATTQVYSDFGIYQSAKSGITLEKDWKLNKDFKNSDLTTALEAGIRLGTGVRDLKSGIDFNVNAGVEYNYNNFNPKTENTTIWQGVGLDLEAKVKGTHPVNDRINVTWGVKVGAGAPLWDINNDIKTFGKDIKRNFSPSGEISFGISL